MKNLISSAILMLTIVIVIASFTVSQVDPQPTSNVKSEKSYAGKWNLDKGHSNVKFTVTHMAVSEVDGSFKSFDGTIESSKPDFSDAAINFTVDVNSVYTNNEKRDGHLKGDDFFNAAQFPQMKFQSTSFKPTGGNKYQLNGNLTIRDITKPVLFEVTYGGSLKTKDGTKVGFKAITTINRFDYNLKWDRATEAGGLVVAKDVVVTINAEFDEAK